MNSIFLATVFAASSLLGPQLVLANESGTGSLIDQYPVTRVTTGDVRIFETSECTGEMGSYNQGMSCLGYVVACLKEGRRVQQQQQKGMVFKYAILNPGEGALVGTRLFVCE